VLPLIFVLLSAMDGKVIMTNLTCFKAYDVRGELGVNFDASIAYRIGRAVARHFKAEKIVVGRDARESSPVLVEALSRGIMDEGAQVLDLGIAGTEEMYWAVTHFGACAGVEVTASHNPINYNGLKIVKSGSRPLDDLEDFQMIKRLAEDDVWVDAPAVGGLKDISFEARAAYVDRVLSFVDIANLRPLKIVVNSGNGAAGPTFDAVAKRLSEMGAPTQFIACTTRLITVSPMAFQTRSCQKTMRRLHPLCDQVAQILV
jgi:phosphomannomutase